MSKEDFFAGLEYLTKHRPNHPLLDVIARGFTDMNVAYLEAALEDCPSSVREQDAVLFSNKSQDPVIDKLNQKLNKLFGNRARLSNSFHICHSDVERAAVSDKIAAVQDDIEKTIKAKKYYTTHDELPPKVDKYPVPESELEVIKLRQSLYSRISQIKRELKSLHQKQNKQDRVEKLQKNLSEKEIYLKYVKRALEEKAV